MIKIRTSILIVVILILISVLCIPTYATFDNNDNNTNDIILDNKGQLPLTGIYCIQSESIHSRDSLICDIFGHTPGEPTYFLYGVCFYHEDPTGKSCFTMLYKHINCKNCDLVISIEHGSKEYGSCKYMENHQ